MIIGPGAQGNVINDVLAQAAEVGTILLANEDLERANEVAQFVGSDKIKVELMVHATLPVFYPPILEACVKAGENYLDRHNIF